MKKQHTRRLVDSVVAGMAVGAKAFVPQAPTVDATAPREKNVCMTPWAK